jgi:ABC-type polar amino acid transport system ATPase subunit
VETRLVQADGVGVRTRTRCVLDIRGIDLQVHESEVVCLVGPSGSGKSTCLRCINRLETPSRGHILLDGQETNRRGVNLVEIRRRIGMVFQQFNLFPHMSVLGNVIEGPVTALHMPRAEAEALGRSLLARVGLSDKADARPSQLSGGQQQRVAIARALAMKPEIMLFDEPTSALDPELAVEVLNIMKQLADDGMTMVVVSHEMPFVRGVSDWLVMMDGGAIVEEGPTAEVFERPAHERTARFLRQFQW